jgi:DNA invertase Pin-like site-specific DNA recombinase
MGLEQFKIFGQRKEEKVDTSNSVWVYTRVSSRDQEANKSLSCQKEGSQKLADKEGYEITNTFGGTYESATGDFTRKEFSKLINAIRVAKVRPFAILIFTMSRFSRTGGKGIALAYELIEELGVNLIEVSTGKNTITKEGRLEIYSGLIKASQENLDRLKVTIPGMKKLLENGAWLGNTPKGYDQYGPRVKDHRFHSGTQKIVLNDEGRVLKQAWKWKLQGEPDYLIIRQLAAMNLKISKQSLADMWRKPFYCGVSCNKMLEGEVVKGNWEKMVSQSDFLQVQEIIKGNHHGYKQDTGNIHRPLNAFICCSECGNKMTGYEVKKKGLHYYKCQTCKEASINAVKTRRAKAKGAHDLFHECIDKYNLPGILGEPFKDQLKRTFETLATESGEEFIMVEKELKKLQEDLKTMNRKYALDPDFDKATYFTSNEFSIP